jgi:hypothetical protein
MNKLLRLAVAPAVLLTGLIVGRAATTNLIYGVNLNFTSYLQESLDTNDVGSVEIVRGTTKDLIALLGAKSGNQFSLPTSKLILKKTLGSGNGLQFFVRQRNGTNVSDTDVSGFLTLSNRVQVKQSLSNGATRYAIVEIVLSSAGGHGDFDVQGFAKEGHIALKEHNEVLEREHFIGAAAAVAGTGEFDDIAGDLKPAVLTSNMVIVFNKVEIQ